MTFGLAYSVEGLRIEDVIRDADEKLYAGKHSGKNRVVDDKHMETGKEESMEEKMGTRHKGLLAVRICLWIVAFATTVYWIYYSIKLHREGILDPAEYSTALRPVLYTCLIISIAAVALSFVLYRIDKKN